MSRALVTGGTGFIGGHLVAALRITGWDVRCLARSPDKARRLLPAKVEIVAGDITDAESVALACRDVDVVFHLAGVTRAFTQAAYWAGNQLGTRNVVTACARRESPPVLIHVSSIAASGPTLPGSVRNESQEPTPISHYGRSKLAGEREVAAQADCVPATILRPGIVFGPQNRECFPIFQAIQRTGIHAVPGWGFPPLSFIAISELVPMLLASARRAPRLSPGKDGENLLGRGCYFATCPEFPSYARFGRLIANAMGRFAFILPIAMPFMFLAGGVAEVVGRAIGVCPSVSIDKMREANARSWACSSSRAANDLGYRPQATLTSHLEATVDWYWQAEWLPAPRTHRGSAQRVEVPVVVPPTGG